MEQEIKDILKTLTEAEIKQAIADQEKALFLMQNHMDETSRKIQILKDYQTGLVYVKEKS